MRVKKGVFETVVVFILSPFLSLPFLFFQLKKGNDKLTVLILSLLVGMMSYLYIPHLTNDKATYFNRNLFFKKIDFGEFWSSLERLDFIFDLSNFFSSKLFSNFNYFFFIITSITIFSILRFVKKTLSFKLKQKYIFKSYSLILIFSIISLNALFSNTRFLLTTSVFIWVIYYLFIDKNLIKAIIYSFISIFLHFSFLVFIPLVLFVYIFPNIFKYSKIILILSTVFLIIPKGIDLLDLLLKIDILPSYTRYKAEIYANDDTVYSQSAYILFYIKNLWFYFLIVFLFFRKKNIKRDFLYTIIVLFILFISLFHSNPFIFGRYSIVLSFFFVIYLIYMYNSKKSLNKVWFIIFVSCIFLHLGVDLLVLRNNLIASYSFEDIFSFYSIFSKNITPFDFLG